METVEFNGESLKKFKELYEKNIERTSFIYEGHVYLVSYAKYLIEYVESKLKS